MLGQTWFGWRFSSVFGGLVLMENPLKITNFLPSYYVTRFEVWFSFGRFRFEEQTGGLVGLMFGIFRFGTTQINCSNAYVQCSLL